MRVDALLLQPMQLFVRLGDRLEGRQQAGLQLRFHRRERDRAFLAVALLGGEFRLDLREFGLGLRRRPRRGSLRHCLRVPQLGRLRDRPIEAGAAVGGVEIDDVAQQHLAFDERVAPADDRANGQRVLADAADHHLAAGLDALGDGDLALARQQLDRPHLAQIHAHRIVGAADIVVVEIAARPRRRPPRPRRRPAPRFPRSR